MNTSSSNVIAACFALCAFAVAILAGLAADIEMAQILLRAMVAMIVCYPVGLVVGVICQREIEAHIRSHQVANPPPEFVDPPVESPGPDEGPIVV